MFRVLSTLLAVVCLLPFVSRADEVRVAVAANFAGAFTRIGEVFTAETGHTLKVSTGATGKFHTQIANGAPFEVVLAADDETPARLVREGHAVSGSEFTYAIGKLVLWSAKEGFVDDQGAVLKTGDFAHLSIANPRVAPYGAAAMEVLKAMGLAESLTPRLVTAESIAQAYQFVVTGNAELGFVALSQVAVPGKPAQGSYWTVPQSMYAEIRQAAVLLKPGENSRAAAALIDHLKSPQARAIIRSFGYGP